MTITIVTTADHEGCVDTMQLQMAIAAEKRARDRGEKVVCVTETTRKMVERMAEHPSALVLRDEGGAAISAGWGGIFWTVGDVR